MGYQLIETIEVGSGGASSIEFTGIPQDGVDLAVLVSLRDSYAGLDWLRYVFQINSSTTATGKRLDGDGSSVSSANLTNSGDAHAVPGASATSNTFSNGKWYISNYASSVNKSVSHDTVTENNATNSKQVMESWAFGSAAVTSIKIGDALNSWVQYSTASLYKITAD